MNLSSAPYAPDVDEFAAVGLTAEPCRNIPGVRLAEAPVSIECRVAQIVGLTPSTGATCTNLLLSDADIDVYEAIGLAAIPAVYVYDTTGKMVKRFDNDSGEFGDEGFTYEAHIVPLIEKLLDAGGAVAVQLREFVRHGVECVAGARSWLVVFAGGKIAGPLMGC